MKKHKPIVVRQDWSYDQTCLVITDAKSVLYAHHLYKKGKPDKIILTITRNKK